MYKVLILTVMSLFFGYANAQADLDFYKVHALNITDLNKLSGTPDVDFGYNYNVVNEKSVDLGYYLWVEDSWYKIINANAIFNANEIAPVFFTINRFNKIDLKIKDQLDVVFSYPIEAIETYKISDKLFNLSLQKHLEENKKKDSLFKIKKEVLPIQEIVHQVVDSVFVSKDSLKTNVILDIEDVSIEVIKKTIPYDQNVSKKDSILNHSDLSKGEIIPEIVADSVLVIKDDIKSIKEKTEKSKPANAYESAVLKGFDGSVTEWIESIDSLGGETAFQQAVKAGFKGTEQEWLRSLWGSNVDPVIEKQNRIAGIVSQWINDLNTSSGYSPYDLALKHGFYGTYTEWIESVIGKDGEEVYNDAVKGGFKGTYKEWIEKKLNASNDETLRKETFLKSNFIVVPNIEIPLVEDSEIVLEFDLYAYYDKFYGSSVVSSSASGKKKVKLLKADLEYQITWYNSEEIEVLNLSASGILSYKSLIGTEIRKSNINVRFVLN